MATPLDPCALKQATQGSILEPSLFIIFIRIFVMSPVPDSVNILMTYLFPLDLIASLIDPIKLIQIRPSEVDDMMLLERVISREHFQKITMAV